MAIFNNTNIFASDVVCEGYEIEYGGAYDVMMESCDDDYAVIEAMHAYDMAEFEAMKESAGELESVSPVMEASLKEIWAKIKAFFANLVKRIKAFFQRLIDYVNSITMSGTEFAKKYKDRLGKLKLAGFSYDMYDYKVDLTTKFVDMKDVKGELDALTSGMDEIKNQPLEDSPAVYTKLEKAHAKEAAEIADEVRKGLAGDKSSEKFSENVYKKLRGGDSKKTIGVTDIKKYVDFLAKSDAIMNGIKKARTEADNLLNKASTIVNKAADEVEGSKVDDPKKAKVAAAKASAMRKLIGQYSAVCNVQTSYLNIYASVVKEMVGVYKSMCFKALQYKPAK